MMMRLPSPYDYETAGDYEEALDRYYDAKDGFDELAEDCWEDDRFENDP